MVFHPSVVWCEYGGCWMLWRLCCNRRTCMASPHCEPINGKYMSDIRSLYLSLSLLSLSLSLSLSISLSLSLSPCLSPPIYTYLTACCTSSHVSIFFPCCFSGRCGQRTYIIFLSASLYQHQNIPNLMLYPFVRFPLRPWHPKQSSKTPHFECINTLLITSCIQSGLVFTLCWKIISPSSWAAVVSLKSCLGEGLSMPSES